MLNQGPLTALKSGLFAASAGLTAKLSFDSDTQTLIFKSCHQLQDYVTETGLAQASLVSSIAELCTTSECGHEMSKKKKSLSRLALEKQLNNKSDNESSSDETTDATTKNLQPRKIKYSCDSIHFQVATTNSFDHNFNEKMTSLPRHLPPITKPSDSSPPPTTTIVQQPQIKSVSSSSSLSGPASPSAERQTRLRNRIMATGPNFDLPEVGIVSKRMPQPRALMLSRLQRQVDDENSETPSPSSSPSSVDEDDPVRNFISTKRSSVRRRSKRVNQGEVEDDEALNTTLDLRKVDRKKSVSVMSLNSMKESDSEESRAQSLHYSRSLRDNLSAPTDTEVTHLSPGDGLVAGVKSSLDGRMPKSRSLACLAAATLAAGQPLMVTEARSRSYLVGSVARTSLLGSEELERCLANRKLRLFIGSWNMNGQTPPAYLADFLLPQNIGFVPDLLAIGTQECMSETKDWEARLQETLGPSHVLFHSSSLGTLHLAIFLRRDLIWFCSVPEVDSFSTRPGANFKTKGAVAIAFILFGTSFLFVNSHLTAHQDNFRDRIKDLSKINAMLNLPRQLPVRKRHSNMTDNFDAVFWCGDLNFRIEATREVVIREVQDGISVLEFDQLNYLRAEGLIFNGFTEDPIHFIPTYKYDPGTNNFDTSSKQRVPSYTDRILYKCHKATAVNPLHYDIVPDVLTSDHKPVWGMWEITLRPGKDNVPLSGGLFNREIYLEGLKRRAEALKPFSKGKMNAMCSIQ